MFMISIIKQYLLKLRDVDDTHAINYVTSEFENIKIPIPSNFLFVSSQLPYWRYKIRFLRLHFS